MRLSEFFPAECSVSAPQGGLVLWIALHRIAIEQRIAFMPGPVFSASGKYGNYLRLNCGNAWSAEIEKAVRTLGLLVRQCLNRPAQLAPG